MENPEVVEKIKNLGKEAAENGEATPSVINSAINEDMEGKQPTKPQPAHSKRRDLLYALKPYLSEERGRAIETMLSITDVLDMMKTR